jgi:hypothetical protein
MAFAQPETTEPGVIGLTKMLTSTTAREAPGSQGGDIEEDRPEWRFDVVAVYYDHGFNQPSFALFQMHFPCRTITGLRIHVERILLKGF